MKLPRKYSLSTKNEKPCMNNSGKFTYIFCLLLRENLLKILRKVCPDKELSIRKFTAAVHTGYFLGNTAQSTSNDFVRHKLVSFPSSCTEILCHTTVCLQNFCTI